MIANTFESAKQHHQAGRLAEAQSLYRQILSEQPNHADALQFLGYAIYQSGSASEAVDYIKRAIAIDPNRPMFYCNLGVVLASLGQHDEAIAACRQALRLLPNFPQASYNLGISLHAKNQLDEAIAAYQRALQQMPNWAEALTNLGNVLMEKGEIDPAISAFGSALAARPTFPEALFNLGNALRKKGTPKEAAEAYRQAVAARPDYAEAYNNLGSTLVELEQFDDGIAALRQAIALRPTYADAYGNLGAALDKNGSGEEAIGIFRKAIALQPDFAEAWADLGLCLQKLRESDEAVIALRKALSLKPDLAPAHYHLAMALLQRGELQEGFSHYSWRWKVDGFRQPRRDFWQPVWNGSELAGQRILLHAEQGFGDAIQFARFVRPVAQRGGKVILECPIEVMRLFKSLEGVEELTPWGHQPPPFHIRCSLLDVPLYLDLKLETLAPQIPYLRAESAAADQWQRRMSEHGNDLKVGLIWAGRPRPEPERTIPLAELAPLGDIPGVRFYSLQVGEPSNEVSTPPKGLNLIDWTDELKDFADTAALMANLDLIITIDSAAAHLAGALGKRTWVLLRRYADWRWLIDRTDSPWYPTATLFRQRQPRQWAEPVAEVVEQLKLLVRK
jgi:tetratricopeptide (TPR) repeat protein